MLLTTLVLCLFVQQPEATSLLGKPLYPMALSEARKSDYLAKLAQAKDDFNQKPDDVMSHIWLGRRTAYLGHYRDAIAIYTRALEKFPREPRLYRHRGHRYISIREFDKARADFRKAAELIAGQPDRVEPDGLPNAAGIPTSTLHTNIWYHYGLVSYLQGDFAMAKSCYEKCLAASKNNDMMVATLDWLYMTLRRLGEHRAAKNLLKPITADMKILENRSYHRRLLMYKGELKPEQLLKVEGDADPHLTFATQGYGVGNYYLVEGLEAQAKKTFAKVVDGPYWAAFGHIAAEADLARLR